MTFLNLKPGIDFTGYIAERTPNFTGREWVFQKICDWLSNPNASRYFLLTGEPGSGKTAIAQRLTQFSQNQESLHPDLLPSFLNAIHICFARDSTSVDPRNFCKSVALQLAQIQDYAIALANIDTKHVNIQATQNLGTVTDSTIQNVVINNLDISGVMTAQEAFNLLVLNPLQYIYQNGFNQPITILVDALDEALTHEGKPTIVDLLSKLENLPAQIRFILTSRKEARIETKFLDIEELYLSASEFNQLNQHDVREYIEKRFVQDEPLSVLVADLKPQQRKELIEQIAEKSEGNFLYVSFLLNAIAKGLRSLYDLKGLPEGLDGLYYQSLERVVELGKKDWYETYAPFMGILSVARSSLNLNQLQAFTKQSESLVWQCLAHLRQFLEEVEPTTKQEEEGHQYRLYHQSVVDFLRKRSLTLGKNTRHNPYYLPALESHQRITDYYWQKAQPLNAVNWHHLDSYAYHHLAYHLLESERKDELYALLTTSPTWMEAKFINCNGHASYAVDLELAINSFSEPLKLPQLLVLIQLHTARQVVYQRIHRYDDIDLRTLVWLGRETEALNHARFRSTAQKKFISLFILYKLLVHRGQPNPSLLRELQETAQSIEKGKWRVSSLEAERVALAIQNNHWKRTLALSELAKALANSEQFVEAERIARAIPKTEWKRVDALGSLVVALVRAGDRANAELLLAEAREVAESIEDSTWKAWALRALVTALTQTKHFVEAEEMAQAIADAEQRAWAMQKLAIASAQPKHFIEAGKAAEAISSIQRVGIFLSLAQALIQIGRHIEANQFFAAAENAAWDEEPRYRESALKELAIVNAQVGRFAESMRIIGIIEDSRKRDEALMTLARGLAQAEHFRDAKQATQAIEEEEKRRWALGSLAIALARQQHFSKALQELGSQTLDDFVHILASCSPIFEQLEAGLSVSALEEEVRIVGWVRPDWRKVADYF